MNVVLRSLRSCRWFFSCVCSLSASQYILFMPLAAHSHSYMHSPISQLLPFYLFFDQIRLGSRPCTGAMFFGIFCAMRLNILVGVNRDAPAGAFGTEEWKMMECTKRPKTPYKHTHRHTDRTDHPWLKEFAFANVHTNCTPQEETPEEILPKKLTLGNLLFFSLVLRLDPILPERFQGE